MAATGGPIRLIFVPMDVVMRKCKSIICSIELSLSCSYIRSWSDINF